LGLVHLCLLGAVLTVITVIITIIIVMIVMMTDRAGA